MERIVILLLLLVMTMSINGEADIKLLIGEMEEIELRENRSTGYYWFYQIEDNHIVDIVEDYYQTPESDPLKAGFSGTRHFKLQGLKKGKTILRLFLARNEKDEDIKDEIIYLIEVES